MKVAKECFDLKEIYRFPFTSSDNPNTVIEPTTRCNLKCPGCYRRTNLDAEREMTVPEMKEYIDKVAKARNSSCISFLGGEPLLHKQVGEAITYAKEQGFNVGLYSNGLLLTIEKLRELKELGVSYILIHVDKHQKRGITEDEINQIRDDFCNMFREVGGVQLGFVFQLMESDKNDIPTMVEYFTKNADIVRVAAFVACTNSTPKDAARPAIRRSIAEVKLCKAVKDAYGLEWSSYLGSRLDENLPGKIMSLSAYRDGKLLYAVDPKSYGAKLRQAREETGRFPYIDNLPWPYASSAPEENIDWHYIVFNFTPFLKSDGLNICDSCTDAVLHEGHYVPMCILEDLRAEHIALEQVLG